MRKANKYKLQNQSNTIKLGNMFDDMWGIHVHIILLARKYYRMFGKNLCKSVNGLLQQNLVVIVDTITKNFLFLIGSGHAPNVAHTTTETKTLL